MRYSLFFILTLVSINGIAQGFLKADGKLIRNGAGEAVILKGMGLGGWMLQEPYMLNLSGGAVAQYDIRNKIAALVGEDNTNKFYEAWLKNHCTKADIDSLAAWGFNSVRLPMHYNLFTLPISKEPEKGKNTWLQKGFELTDSLLSWCAANKLYLVLDLHAAPGGQGNDNAISDRDASQPSLWESEDNKNKTIALWEKLATRYKDAEWIGGYDLVNEPNWGFDTSRNANGCDENENKPLLQLLKDITKAIRAVDTKHIIFIEGNCWGNNYNGMFPLWDNNLVLSFHKYWNYNDQAAIQKYLDYRERYNIPLWLGETGENSNAWFTDMLRLLKKNQIGWAMWPLKKFGINNPVQVKTDPGIQHVLEYLSGKGPRPTVDAAVESLLRFAANTNIRNGIIRYDVIDALVRQVDSSEPLPFRQNIIAGGFIIYATDYDLGRSGVAYHDKDSAEYWVSTSKRTGWNTGGKYRNDGVDIEVCNDSISNGYNVGWIEPGEWLEYSIYSPARMHYLLDVRSRTSVRGAKLKLVLNGKPYGSMGLPKKGRKAPQWVTKNNKHIILEQGWNRLRLQAETGGFDLNYIQFISAGNSTRLNNKALPR